ncbi:MAG: hypothetical protein J7L26_10955 [Candidatus Aminicenantes bacterium]|nr:hypothetical protein [Candidatus Aminicenantes bacterium]
MRNSVHSTTPISTSKKPLLTAPKKYEKLMPNLANNALSPAQMIQIHLFSEKKD